MYSRSQPRRLAAVLFADLVGYSSLACEDEHAAMELLDILHGAAQQEVERTGGRLVKRIGDAVFAEFGSTEAAVRAALELQVEFAQRVRAADVSAALRIGIHVGDVIPTPDGDLYGDGINIAARLQAEAEPGSVLVSEDVWRQMRPRREFSFSFLGSRTLKGIHSPVAVYVARNVVDRSAPPRPEESPIGLQQKKIHGTTPERSPSLRSLVRPHHVVVVVVACLFLVGAVTLTQNGRETALAPGRTLVAALENETGDPGLDPLSHMTADWITQGLASTGLVEVVPSMTSLRVTRRLDAETPLRGSDRIRALADATGAGIVISGAYYKAGDSIQIRVDITDVEEDRVLRSIGPISGSARAPQDAVLTAQQQVVAALATVLNPRLTSREGAASQPPNYAAYQEYLAGANAFIRNDNREAIARFAQAAAFDSTYTLPLLFAAFAYLGVDDYAAADSLARIVERNRDRLVPLDRHHLDNIQATLRGDHMAALLSSREMVRIAPGSEWLYEVARCAVLVNRPREAVAALEQIDPERWPMKGWIAYWQVLADAHHLLGDHRRELRVARQAGEMHPDQISVIANEVKALAALGREQEATRRAVESVGLPGDGWYTPSDVMEIAALELRAHGRPQASDALFDRALAHHPVHTSQSGAKGYDLFDHARLLYNAGRWAEAKAEFRRLRADDPGNPSYVGYLGLIAVRTGNAAEGRMASEALQRVDDPYLFGENTYLRARIAALLRNREQAVSLLGQAFAEGLAHDPRLEVHHSPDFESLRDYPPFRTLLRPKG